MDPRRRRGPLAEPGVPGQAAVGGPRQPGGARRGCVGVRPAVARGPHLGARGVGGDRQAAAPLGVELGRTQVRPDRSPATRLTRTSVTARRRHTAAGQPDTGPAPDAQPDGAKPRQARTGCAVYFGSDGSWHIRKLDPRAPRITRRWRQRWHRLSGNGSGTRRDYMISCATRRAARPCAACRRRRRSRRRRRRADRSTRRPPPARSRGSRRDRRAPRRAR